MNVEGVFQVLTRQGFHISSVDIALAIRSGSVSRPEHNELGQFVFKEQHVQELRELFRRTKRQGATTP